MTLTIVKDQTDKKVKIYYDTVFMSTLESHIPYLKSLKSTSQVQLDPSKVHPYLGDFDSMLLYLGIERQYHWFIARINGIYSNSDFNESITRIYVPDSVELDRIKTRFMVTRRVQL